ncbi:hypothetical protein DFJ58DRAFT_843645 [Suillus subalutaceus]|uniref:uncharacterized protein n=1 Tax=Suillus subalutaceus TaxID=48586 RepID=UPI001B862114|nr:uncharacterized protein DFJ58DRAFT_843645 [Suillus subalutaceus]KAG1845891.1 hypothetical protein DFJ58DRAFT_843645 [Suillus subalutaceus]
MFVLTSNMLQSGFRQFRRQMHCRAMYDIFDWTGILADVMLGAMIAMTMTHVSGEGFVLFGTFQCMMGYAGNAYLLISMTWILGTVWEVLVLCLAVWIAMKHFRELRQTSTGGILRDFLRVLVKTHASYFASSTCASFLVVSCFEMSYLSPTISTDLPYLETQIYSGFIQIFQILQMFVLGPRLILSLREYHAKLVADSDTATVMTSIAFQERVRVETSSSV